MTCRDTDKPYFYSLHITCMRWMIQKSNAVVKTNTVVIYLFSHSPLNSYGLFKTKNENCVSALIVGFGKQLAV